MKILLLEPFFTGSHRAWAKAYQRYSAHEVALDTLPGRHWKWRMYGGAVSMAQELLKRTTNPDLILATDMLDLSTYLSLTKMKTSQIPTALYFHENQITYPWSPQDQDVKLQRNNQYGFINYTSALAADQLFFNSAYHLESFTKALPEFLQQFPDHRTLELVEQVAKKSQVLSLGLELHRFKEHQMRSDAKVPILLWNHRWEYDKNPDLFFRTLFRLKAENIDFQLLVLGESYRKSPPIFAEAQKQLADRLLHFGYVEQFADYAQYLWLADILPVSSHQDFFGGSVVEAMYCNCIPILPHRLAYPEHLPSDLHAEYFYDNDEMFYQKVKQCILFSAQERKAKAVQNFVARYDWSNLAPQYDQVFQKLVERSDHHPSSAGL